MSEQKKRKKAKYKSVIIGAGRIAAQFDSPKSGEVLTHAHAYLKHPKTVLAAFFDKDKKAAENAAKKWNCGAYSDLDKMFKEIKPDIVSICTPDKTHFDVLLRIAKYRPGIVICEKPITTNLNDSKKIIKLYDKLNIPVLVNYSRNFDKTVQIIKKEIDREKYGKVISASSIYAKGILHSGSHLISLCRFLFGEAKKISVDYAISDFYKNDRTIAGFIKFEKCRQFNLIAADERKYSIFELDILLEKKRYRFFDFGFKLASEEVMNDPLYAGYKCLGNYRVEYTSLINTMSYLIENAVDNLESGKDLVCGMRDGFKTQKICFDFIKKAKNL